jgi:hypothetical protein
MTMKSRTIAVLTALLAGTAIAGAAEFATKDEAMAMVKKASAMIKDYKFVNPTNKKIEPKQMYCEKLDETTVCAGVYKL